jgi:hypothetical protein
VPGGSRPLDLRVSGLSDSDTWEADFVYMLCCRGPFNFEQGPDITELLTEPTLDLIRTQAEQEYEQAERDAITEKKIDRFLEKS